MIRPKPLLGAAALAILAGTGLFWMTRRTPGTPPSEEAAVPFRAEAVGAGSLLELQPPPVPLRAVRWVGPLPGRAAVAQILTQTGRQQAALFLEGRPAALAAFDAPAGLPQGYFPFADLVDAAVVPGREAVLLYRGPGGESGLVLVWELDSGRIRSTLRAPGDHLALSPDGRSAFLYGGRAGVTILNLAGGSETKVATTLVELPPEVGAVSGLLPTGPRAFHLAHPGGLSTWRNGVWTHASAPLPSLLGFPAGSGRLAGGAAGAWWQPEPGQLLPIGADGTPGEPRDLKALLPSDAALDAAMLSLLGEDADGQLWFGLSRPTLPVPAPPPPPSPEAAPPDATSPSVPAQGPGPLDDAVRAAWTAHLQKGLDRVYRWRPGASAMKPVGWSAVWKDLAPPPGIAPPVGDGGLRPEAGGLLLGAPDRMWWLSLGAIQPR